MVIFKKICASIFILGVVISFTVPIAEAAGYLPLKSEKIKEYGITVPEGTTAQEQAQNIVIKIVDYARYIVGALATLYIVISGIKLVLSQGEKDVYDKQIKNIIYAGIGLVVIAMAGELKDIFTLEGGGFLRDPNRILQQTNLFNNTMKIILTFVKYIAGSFCVLSIVNISLRLITYSSEDEELSIDKKNLFYSFLGLLIIMVSDIIVNKIVFKVDRDQYPGVGGVQVFPDVSAGVKLIASITNTIAAFAAPVSILLLLAGAIVYITAGGDETRQETAKKIILYNIIGLIIIYGAYAIVSTFIVRSYAG